MVEMRTQLLYLLYSSCARRRRRRKSGNKRGPIGRSDGAKMKSAGGNKQ